MKRILVTGAGGYIGSVMVETFLERGFRVVGLDRYFFGVNLLGKKVLNHPQFQLLRTDIRWVSGDIFKDVDVVIDLASLSNDPSGAINPALTDEINHKGRVRIARLAKESGVKRYILASSCSVYGHGTDELLTEDSPTAPITEYAKANISAEREILPMNDEHFVTTALRQATVYGLSPRMRFDLVINLMTLHAAQKGKIFIMGGGKQWRPLVHVKDTVEAFIKAVKAPKDKIGGEIFNIGSSEQNYQIVNLAYLVKENIPFRIEVETAPDDPDKRDYHVSFDKIKNVLGFRPRYTPEMGIQEIYQALKAGKVDANDKTVTVRWYKYLIDADNSLSSVKIEGKLF